VRLRAIPGGRFEQVLCVCGSRLFIKEVVMRMPVELYRLPSAPILADPVLGEDGAGVRSGITRYYCQQCGRPLSR
jgi:DNA-directed RNA polymerase subunit RPC12/RpoP